MIALNQSRAFSVHATLIALLPFCISVSDEDTAMGNMTPN